jgi:hypothetical protein
LAHEVRDHAMESRAWGGVITKETTGVSVKSLISMSN